MPIDCSEHEILREEIKSLQDIRIRHQQRIQELEEELKKVKEEAEDRIAKVTAEANGATGEGGAGRYAHWRPFPLFIHKMKKAKDCPYAF